MRTKSIFGLVVLLAVFLVGGVSGRNDLFPWPQVSALKKSLAGTDGAEAAEASRYVFQPNGRLVADESKTVVDCPKQTDRTAVLLVLGQSNAANHGGQRYRSAHGDRVVNYFGKRCFIAASPLLGSTDARGEYWTELGNLLGSSGKYDNVVIAPLAFSGSDIARWMQGGDLNKLLAETASQLKDVGYRVTNVLWVQGESDYVLGTSAETYEDRFRSMAATMRQHGIDAPIYVSVATKCLEPSNGGLKTHILDNSIARAQVDLANSGQGFRLGVDTDTLLDEVDRYDDCHIGGSGGEKASRAWAEILLADRPIASSQ